MPVSNIQFVRDQATLATLAARISAVPVFALDIETINWWDRARERIALVQLAYRDDDKAGDPRVVVIDALAGIDLEPLRRPLELSASLKAIHNASYDAVRLSRHLHIRTSPIHDTMLAARRSGERKCSLQAQVETHLGLHLDKTDQRSDWSLRPLGAKQLQYAALDAACTLLLYELQLARGLRGDYELRDPVTAQQVKLPLTRPVIAAPDRIPVPVAAELAELEAVPEAMIDTTTGLGRTALALLGIVSELNGRYSPEQLAASVGSERVGMAGWIIDRMIGGETDVDEGSARLAIASLCERQLVGLSLTRRLEATPSGTATWQRIKPSAGNT